MTDIARNMVTKWGLSQKLGPLTYSDDEGEVFLGKSVTQQKIVSDETAHLIDEEVRNIVDRNYKRAHDILENNTDKLHVMADALIRYESLDTGQIDEISGREKPSPPSDWSDNNTPPGDGGGVKSDEAINKNSNNDPEKPIGGPASSH